MSSFSHFKRLSAVSTFVLGMAIHSAFAAANPPVQTYVDQAAPLPPPDGYYDSPVSAGTLTLQDVLEAHPKTNRKPDLPPPGTVPPVTATAPILNPAQSSSTASMMSQGMKDVLSKVSLPPDAQSAAAPLPVPSSSTAAPTPLTPAAPATQSADGLAYQPGQAPRNLGAEIAPPPAPGATVPPPPSVSTSAPAADVAMPASGEAAADQSCDQHVTRWEKTCADAGYPTTFTGKIVGETRTGCSDGALHDVWVTNSCAPPDYSAQATKVDGACGVASNNEFDDAPSANLCSQGIPSATSGDGPWTWACSGINGGAAAACSAHKRGASSNGICGSANGQAVGVAPTENLCDGGTQTSVGGSGPWTWTCKGIGSGLSQSCIAPAISKKQDEVAVEQPAADEAAVPSPPPAAQDSGVSADTNNLCGEAAETLAYTAPEKDLCRAGTASAVNGDGPWSWSCTTNEGATSTCKTLSLNGDGSVAVPAVAPVASVLAVPPAQVAASHAGTASAVPFAAPAKAEKELACGSAAAQPATQAPNSDLCENGKASAVRGSKPWRWTCRKGHASVSCQTPTPPQVTEGSCGPANGSTLKAAPFAGLCAAGTPSSVEGNGPWTWYCNGNGGGVNISCAAGVQAKEKKIDGVCGNTDGTSVAAAPATDLCASGTASGVSGEGPWSWACSGSNGGAVGSCSANKIVPPKPPGLAVNGQCGAANGTMVSSQPSDDLCGAGEVSGPVGNGPWNWSCVGVNGGMTVSCTAPLQPPAPIDGACGDANGISTLVRPQSGLCSSGIVGAVNGNGPWTWTCSGANGGTPASCVAPMAGKVAAMPSAMEAASGMAITDDAAPASGLVTPHLPSSDHISSLDRKVLPSLTPSETLKTPPVASVVPARASVAGEDVATAAPDLPNGMEPVQPPAIGSALPSAPVLQEDAEAPHIPGNHLTLDPTISTILFTPGSGNIDDAVLPTLNKLSIVLQSNPDARISLIAFADNTNSTPRDARRLSLTRALAIKDFLSSKGISESRVDVHAEGANTTSGYIDRVDVKVND